MNTNLFFSIFFSSIFFSHAQEQKKDSITQLEEVILLDVFKTSSATGIVPSSVIGRAEFENYSPVDIVSSINQISGVYVLSGALNTNRITIRGVGARTLFGTDKLRLYYNDIPVTNGTGFSTIEAFDLENLNSIEVIKGPKGTVFGTNLGGAILLKSKQLVPGSTNLTNSFTVGSYNLLKNNLGFSHNDGKFSIGLQYNHLETDGYRENNSFDRDGILLNSAYQLNAANKIGFLLNYIDYSAQIPSSLGITAFEDNPKQAAANWKAAKGFEANRYTLMGVSYSHEFSNKLENTTSIFYTYLDHYEPRPFNILDEFTNGYGLRTRFTGSLNFMNRSAKYSLGAELYKDEYNWATFENLYQENNGNGSLMGNKISDNKEFRRQLNAFGSLNLPLTDAFTAQIGLNINKTNYDFRDLFNSGTNNKSAERDFDAIFLPSLNLSYSFTEGYRIYSNISRGFSNPGLEETLTPDGVINPDIVQEKGTNYELGTSVVLDHGKLGIELAIYWMDIKDLLVAQRIGEDQFIGKNAGSTKHQGLELDISYAMKIAQEIQLIPFLGYTFSDHSFVDFVDGDNDFSGNPLTGVPKHRINAGLQLKHFNGFYWNTTLQYVDGIPLTDDNTLYSEAFNVVHTRIGYKNQLSEKFIFGINFGVNNVFNTRYAQSVLINASGFGGAEPRYFYPGNSQNYYGAIELRLKL